MNIKQVKENRGVVARTILEDLPEWFGRPDANEEYILGVNSRIMFAAFETPDQCVGFLSLTQHSPVTAEAYVLGVAQKWHRKGIGRALFGEAEQFLIEKSFRYLTVKTLADTVSDKNYKKTRLFYTSIGFEILEVFPTLWGENTPCLMMIKSLV